MNVSAHIPVVSIILPVYNGEKYIENALKSIFRQEFKDYELLLIDDGSTDNTKTIVLPYRNSYDNVRLIHNRTRQGLVAALNTGLQLAKGEYIARIDADDRWLHSAKLSLQVKFLRDHSDYGIIGTFGYAVTDDGRISYKITPPLHDAEIRRTFLTTNPFLHPSVLFLKIAALSSGGYRKEELLTEDYGLWLRIGLKLKCANLPLFAIAYQLTSGGETQRQNTLMLINTIKLITAFRIHYPRYYQGLAKRILLIILNMTGGRLLASVLKKFYMRGMKWSIKI